MENVITNNFDQIGKRYRNKHKDRNIDSENMKIVIEELLKI